MFSKPRCSCTHTCAQRVGVTFKIPTIPRCADTFDKDRNWDGFGRAEADRFGVVRSAVDEDQQRLLRHRFPQTVIHGNVGGIPFKVIIVFICSAYYYVFAGPSPQPLLLSVYITISSHLSPFLTMCQGPSELHFYPSCLFRVLSIQYRRPLFRCTCPRCIRA